MLDVRSINEFRDDGHIEQALNIPVENLEQQLSKLNQHNQQSISIVCKTDKRSVKAANLLLKHGFQNVHVVQGGMADWDKKITGS